MQFIPTVDTYADDQAAKNVWQKLEAALGEIDGICYYKHPIIVGASTSIPDLSLIANGYQPIAMKCIRCAIDELDHVAAVIWSICGEDTDSPMLEIDDFIVGLQHKFDRERELRKRLSPIAAIVFPLVARSDFEKKFGKWPDNSVKAIWSNLDFSRVLQPIQPNLTDRQWQIAKSVFQGASPLNRNVIVSESETKQIGPAIKVLEKEISLLDEEQHKVAVQMAPGPQRIRGLAGTGKTVILAMKAANIHRRYPEKKILFTFNTQSLYNQTKNLITKFYRDYSEEDPNWENLHIRHAWGSRARPGVYYEICKRLGTSPLTFQEASRVDFQFPFRACCTQVLAGRIESYYDFILLDEAQDFPREFFLVLAKLISTERRIYWAYDELQSLAALEIPRAEELFGLDEFGKPFISLEGDDYPGGIEKDFVLHRSYRCPLDVLMLAHGIGLGLHGPRGSVQMLTNRSSWDAIGYEILEGNLSAGEPTVIKRPIENSPNKIKSIYTGQVPVIDFRAFKSRDEELEWVSNSICNDIENEKIPPDNIVVISLDSKLAREYHKRIQARLMLRNIRSTIPGLVDYSWEFGEPGHVTLSTIYRAKGNEAPVVYIISFDVLGSYAEEIETRNRAFTAISRSKGFVRITGAGGRVMSGIVAEITHIMNDIPYFRFVYPNLSRIRKLDASETSRRRKQVSKAKKSIKTLVDLEKEALSDIDRGLLKELKKKLGEIGIGDED